MAIGIVGSSGEKSGIGIVDDKKEEQKEKLIYIAVRNFDGYPPRWYVLNADAATGKIMLQNLKLSYPKEVRNLMFTACVIEGSTNLYFLGGMNDLDNVCYNQVFIYNITSGNWNVAKPMLSPRAFHRAVIVQNKIYVFGCLYVGKAPLLSRNEWAECYDLYTKEWSYLPLLPEEAYSVSDIESFSLYESGNKILFWFFRLGVFAYDYVSEAWTHFKPPTIAGPFPRWSSTAAVLDNIVIWYFFGKMYAHDFIQNCTFELVTLPELKCCEAAGFIPDVSPDCCAALSYVVSLGNGKVCLIALDDHPRELLYCCTFSLVVERSQEDGLQPASSTPRLVREFSELFEIGGYIDAVV